MLYEKYTLFRCALLCIGYIMGPEAMDSCYMIIYIRRGCLTGIGKVCECSVPGYSPQSIRVNRVLLNYSNSVIHKWVLLADMWPFETHVICMQAFKHTTLWITMRELQECTAVATSCREAFYLMRWKQFRITSYFMMTSSNGNIFRVTGHLCGEFTGPRWIPRTKASDAELWCFLWSASG